MANLLKDSDVVKTRQNQICWFCLTHSQPMSSPVTAHSEPRKKGGRDVCVRGSEQGKEPPVQGMHVEQISLFWSFKLQILNHQLVRNSKKQHFEHLWDFLPFSKR